MKIIVNTKVGNWFASAILNWVFYAVAAFLLVRLCVVGLKNTVLEWYVWVCVFFVVACASVRLALHDSRLEPMANKRISLIGLPIWVEAVLTMAGAAIAIGLIHLCSGISRETWRMILAPETACAIIQSLFIIVVAECVTRRWRGKG